MFDRDTTLDELRANHEVIAGTVGAHCVARGLTGSDVRRALADEDLHPGDPQP